MGKLWIMQTVDPVSRNFSRLKEKKNGKLNITSWKTALICDHLCAHACDDLDFIDFQGQK